MSRKHIVKCDRCGFEEETDGINTKNIGRARVIFGGVPVDGSEADFQNHQDMCIECRHTVVQQLKVIFEEKS